MTASAIRRVTQPQTGTIVQELTCGACLVDRHRSCPARVRNGFKIVRDKDGLETQRTRRFIQCPCPCPKPPIRCLDCGNTHPDEVHHELWECLDPMVCQGRIAFRQANSSLYQQIQQCKSDAAVRRKRAKRELAIMTAQIPAREDEFLDYVIGRQARREPRPAVGECICCGEPTRGGRFLPGHDAKYKSILRGRARTGDVEAQAELERRGWN